MPMAGRGSRFGDKYTVPKPFLEVDGVPMVVRATQDLPHCERKIFITQQEHIRQHIADVVLQEYFPKAEVLGIDHVTEGQAITCELGIKHFGVSAEDPILISACDHGQIYSDLKWLNILHDQSIDVAVWSFTGHPTTQAKPEAWGWLRTKGSRVTNVHCKYLPYDLNPEITPVITGTMFFRKAKYFLDGLAANRRLDFRTNGEFYVDNVLNRCIESGLNVRIFPIDKYICWGLPEDYEANKRMA